MFLDLSDEETGYDFPIRHCSNSAGIVELKDANMDMVRAGITLYGLWPSEEVSRDIISLKPVLSLKSHIVYVKEISYPLSFPSCKRLLESFSPNHRPVHN